MGKEDKDSERVSAIELAVGKGMRRKKKKRRRKLTITAEPAYSRAEGSEAFCLL